MSSRAVIQCPHCASASLWKFGKHPKTREQRYRCKACLHQFVPGHTRSPSPHTPLPVCPRCGARMDVYKHLADSIRFRCSKYRESGSAQCAHKLNLPLGKKTAFTLITQPKDIALVRSFPRPGCSLRLPYILTAGGAFPGRIVITDTAPAENDCTCIEAGSQLFR